MSLDKGRRRWTMRRKAPLNAFQFAFEGRLTPTSHRPSTPKISRWTDPNTGVLRQDSPLGGDDQDWVHALAVNVLGARVAADAVLPVLREGRGSLLFTGGGGLALLPHPQFASLSIGKAALRAYVQALHAQLAGTGVHATSVTIAAAIGGGDTRFDPAVLAQAYLDHRPLPHRPPLHGPAAVTAAQQGGGHSRRDATT
jgi:NAD(P)-dependent dehydrogenase (short-subunit alcohol dehydrogenase family)